MNDKKNASVAGCGARPADLVAHLQALARACPDALAYVYLEDGEREGARLTFSDLDRRARAIAARLQGLAPRHARALLLYPPGLDYVEAFFGCLYAGVIAVPAYPPTGRHLQRLRSILIDAEPAVIMTTNALLARLSQDVSLAEQAVWCATDGLDSRAADDWRAPALCPNDIAFLQYTSGSTGDPRGVMVSHGNLVANQALIKKSFGHDENSTLVGWLPLYHDMGLIGNILQPLYAGAASYLMSPMAFLEKPIRWLNAISNYRAHTSGGPNFGYELCVSKITEAQKEGLDLSSWRIAFSGAEPVRAATLARFARAFAPCGFAKRSFYPCYGLAEATLVVSAPSALRETPIRSLERKSLEQDRAVEARAEGVPVVGCGHEWPTHRIRIVDPASLREKSDGEIGEIWVSGPSVAKGYWRRATQSAELFDARIAGEDGAGHLRTGDLGFLDAGELYVTGRLKDLIIIGGGNYYPNDIEAAIEEAVEGVRDGATAAIPMTDGDVESYVILAEPRRADLAALRREGGRTLIRAIRAALAEAIDIAPRDIVLLKPGSTPKTSSGKIRRAECRRALLAGEFDVIARACELNEEAAAPPPRAAARGSDPLLRLALQQLPPAKRAPIIARLLVSEAARLLRVGEDEIDAEAPISRSGLDSLKAMELRHTIEQMLGVAPPLELLLSDASYAQAASTLSGLEAETEPPAADAEGTRLSFSQSAMWTAQQLDAGSVIYNLHLALALPDLDAAKLRAALAATIAANDQLRTLYRATDAGAEAVETTLDDMGRVFQTVDARGWSKGDLQADFTRRAMTAFDLARDVPIRATLYRREQESVLLLVAHHIAVDLWSLLLFITELDARYRGAPVGASRARYARFAAAQHAYLETSRAEADWLYWRDRLGGDLPILRLPQAIRAPLAQRHAGASRAVRLDARRTAALEALAKREGITLYTALLAAYFILLHRYTGQRDLIVGAPTSGRTRAEFAETIGNFVNPVPIRATLRPSDTARETLRHIHERTQEALLRQSFPFPVLVDRLHPTRDGDRWPIYQTTFVLQQAQSRLAPDLAVLALGEAARPIDLFGARARIEEIADRVEAFDLKAMAAKDAEGLLLSFQYRKAALDDATVEALSRHYLSILERLIDDADVSVAQLQMRDAADDRRLVDDQNATAHAGRHDDELLHAAFERRAEAAPEAVAVSLEGETLNYAELNNRANRLAHHLRQHHGVGPDDIVAVCAERSIDLVVTLLAIVKAGAAYLPLDADLPVERLGVMSDGARPRLVLAQQAFTEKLRLALGALAAARLGALEAEQAASVDQPSTNPTHAAHPENLAYVIYTSGSTGRPKPVGSTHRGAVNRLDWMQHRFQLEADDAILQKTSYSFDVSVWEFFWPLREGARLVLAPPGAQREPRRLAEIIARERVTTVHFVPSLLQAFVATPDLPALTRLRRVICSGEALTSVARDAFFASQTAELHNLYGPTEASIDVTAYACDRDDPPGAVSIGAPIWNTQAYILDASLSPAPHGVVGELYLGGIGLARGYLNQPGLTAERFIPNPFAANGERIYRTGDLARRAANGDIDYVGRVDHQVKIRGFRIELGEIESALLEINGLASATVVARDDTGAGASLVAYVTTTPEATPGQAEIRQALSQKLPAYMIPAAIVMLATLPLNRNGKVDRAALPAPTMESLRQGAHVAPTTPMEQELAAVWEAILGVSPIGRHDNFFDVGGDSIRAIQIANRLSRAGLSLTPRDIFLAPTIGGLAALLETTTPEARIEPPAPRHAPFELSELAEDELDDILAEHPDAQDIYRLTPLQEGMLLYSLAQEQGAVYHLQERYFFRGKLEVAAFFDAWRSVVARHDVLRTSFHLDQMGRPYQLVHRASRLECAFEDFSSLDRDEQQRAIDLHLETALKRGFDLARAPLLRIHLLKLAGDLHVCVREFHHIILDDWCTSPLMLDVRTHYEAATTGRTLSLAPPLQFRDYIAWLRGQDVADAKQYWTSYLAGFTDPTPLVIAKEGQTAAAAEVDDVFEELSRDEFEALKTAARAHRLTINTFVQGAVGLLLCRYAAVSEAVFGVTVAGRPADMPGCDEALGLFINALPLRINISPEQRVSDWLQRILATNVEMRQYEFVSQTVVQQCSEVQRADALLFQHLLTFENAPIDQRLLNDRSVFDIGLAGLRVHTNYPVTFVAIPGENLSLRITYDRERFDADDMRRMIRHWALAIRELSRNISGVLGDLAPLDAGEQRRVIVEWNRTARNYGEPGDLVARFEQQARDNPDAVAAACCGETLTFAALNARSNGLAHALVAKGFGPDDIIAIFEERSLDFLTSMLGIFKCGAGYLPIDPAYPDGRISSVLEEAHVAAVLAGPAHVERAAKLAAGDPAGAPPILNRAELEGSNNLRQNPQRRHGSRDVAFVIYTSGSTGKPKGALVEHRGMFNNLITKVPALGLTSSDVIAQTASQCFDISVWQFLLGLAIGARVEIFPDEISRDPEKLIDAVVTQGVTILESVPSMIRALLDAAQDGSFGALRWLIPCGEAFTPELCRRVMSEHPQLKLLNAYGPAECSDDVTYYPILEAPEGNELSTSIGKPVDNCEIYVLDRWLNPVPIGAPGEICVGGLQVGRGYLHRPDLTANVFQPNPFGPSGDILYRTGDLGRWRPDGNLDFLGRVDHQVKIRGHRIEPGEIEACLVAHPTAQEACVLPRMIDKGVYQLVAYVVGTGCDRTELRAFLSETLPDFMIPAFFVFLDAMPLTPNGKIDRRRLPLPEPSPHVRPRLEPRTPTEETLCAIWAELLDVKEVSVDDNFFELGGHSLLAIQLRSRISSAFDVEIPLKDLFSNTTVEALALQIEEMILAEIDAMDEAQAADLNALYACDDTIGDDR